MNKTSKRITEWKHKRKNKRIYILKKWKNEWDNGQMNERTKGGRRNDKEIKEQWAVHGGVLKHMELYTFV